MSEEAAAKFTEAELVPSVIPAGPKAKLDVVFSGKPAVEFGPLLHTLDTKHAPKVSFQPIAGNLYTLVMIDPDNLSRQNPSEAEWLHWLVINVQSDAVLQGTMPKPVMGYSGPSPQPRTGQHRYVVLLYDQGKRKVSQPAIKTRAKFKVKDFAEKHKLGDPVAGNYFISQHGETK